MSKAVPTDSDRERRAFAEIFESATGIYPHAVFGRKIRFTQRPLDAATIDVDALHAVHVGSWPEGLTPTRDALRQMIANDLVFAALDHDRIVAAVHARLVAPGSSLRACAIALGEGQIATERIPRIVTRTPAVVCHAAVTHRDYRSGRIAQRLLTEAVLPYVASDPRSRDATWLTSSPGTYLVDVGREIPDAHDYPESIALLARAVRRRSPAGFSSLRDIVECASPAESARATRSRRDEPAACFARLFGHLPTHQELTTMRAGGPAEQRRALDASAYAAGISEVDHDQRKTARFLLHYLAAALAQAGAYDATTGRPRDPILRFHLANGGRLHPAAGPVPESRPEDVAALGFGQVILYTRGWENDREQNRAVAEARRQRCRKSGLAGTEIDLKEAAPYLEAVVERAADFFSNQSLRSRT